MINLNASEKNFCDRIKDFKEKLDERYILLGNWENLKSALISELDERYALKGADTTPADTTPAAVIRVTYDLTTTKDYDSATIDAEDIYNHTTIDASECNVPVYINIYNGSKVITAASAGGSIDFGTGQDTVYCGAGDDYILYNYEPDVEINNFGSQGDDYLVINPVYANAVYSDRFSNVSVASNNDFVLTHNIVGGETQINFKHRSGVRDDPVTKVPFIYDGTNIKGYYTEHGKVIDNTLEIFAQAERNKVDLNSSLYSGVSKVDASAAVAANFSAGSTITANSISGSDISLRTGNTNVVGYYADNSPNLTISGHPVKLRIFNGTITNCETCTGGYKIYVGNANIFWFDIGTQSTLSVYATGTGGSYKTYDCAAADWS